jgi:hypothetical protein
MIIFYLNINTDLFGKMKVFVYICSKNNVSYPQDEDEIIICA